MISFRAALPRDRAFCVESFLDSYRTAYTAGLIAMEDWNDVMRPQIGKMLDRASVTVAHEADDPDSGADLLGFIAFDVKSFRLPYVYYIYAKQNYRRWGLGRALFKAAGIDPAKPFNYAASTRMCRILSDKAPLARHAPLLARFPLESARKHDVERTAHE